MLETPFSFFICKKPGEIPIFGTFLAKKWIFLSILVYMFTENPLFESGHLWKRHCDVIRWPIFMILVSMERRDPTLYHGTKQSYFGPVNFKFIRGGNHPPPPLVNHVTKKRLGRTRVTAHPMCCKLGSPANTAATPVFVLDPVADIGMVYCCWAWTPVTLSTHCFQFGLTQILALIFLKWTPVCMSVFTSCGIQMLDSNLVLNMKTGLLCLASLELMVRWYGTQLLRWLKIFHNLKKCALSEFASHCLCVEVFIPVPMPYAFHARISVSRNPKLFSRLYSFPIGTCFMSVFADFTNSSLAAFDAITGVKGLFHFFSICNVMFFVHPYFHMGFHRWNLPIANVFASVKVGS